MTASEWASWAQAVAGLATFAAACVAVKAAYDAPKRAAEFAERLRSQSAKSEMMRQAKLNVFSNLLQYRGQILNPHAVASLNVIEIAFEDAKDVRLAWKHFYAAIQENPSSNDKIVERYLGIVQAMARHLSMGDSITVEDVKTYYYPTGLGQLDEAAWLEAQDKIRRYRSPPEG